MPSEKLLIVTGCDLCPEVSNSKLYALVDGVRLCNSCWRAAGRPACSPSQIGLAEQAAMEVKIRERMQRRGGADRHLVRKGKT